MRKSEHEAVVAGLKSRIERLEAERDSLLKELHGKADAAVAAIGKVGDDLAGLGKSVRSDLKAHRDALGKHGETVAGHTEAVTKLANAVSAAAAPEAEVPEPTPITRGSGKATG